MGCALLQRPCRYSARTLVELMVRGRGLCPHRLGSRKTMVALAMGVLSALVNSACDRGRSEPRLDPPALSVVADTRLLIFAPHPDDEVLAAGGFIQRVRDAGGTVRVVYITSGDAYTDSVMV